MNAVSCNSETVAPAASRPSADAAAVSARADEADDPARARPVFSLLRMSLAARCAIAAVFIGFLWLILWRAM